MANTGVKGQIIYAEESNGIPNLDIHVVDIDPITSDDLIEKGKTDNNGFFHITYSSSKYGHWFTERKPDLLIRVYTRCARLVYESPVQENVEIDIYVFDIIKIHRNHIGEANDPNSWLVTNATLDPAKGDAVFLTNKNKITWLVDGDKMFPAINDAANSATRSINFMNMNFWLAGNMKLLKANDLLITKFDPSFNTTNPPPGTQVPGEKFEEIIKTKAAEGKDVNVVVGNLPFGQGDTVELVETYFQGSKVKWKKMQMGLSFLHAKAVIIDHITAFVVGSTFSQSYFNSSKHPIHDVIHRGSLIHDVSVKVEGPAVSHIEQSFATVWNAAEPIAPQVEKIFIDPPTNDTQPSAPVGIQVIRTLPGGFFKTSDSSRSIEDIKGGETAVLEAYQRAIANARNFIYIEDQYFTSDDIINAIIIRMQEQTALEVIVLLNVVPDIPGYTEKQMAKIKQIQATLGSAQNRIGFFTLWSTQLAIDPLDKAKPFEIMPIYIHSKTAIIDDSWATTGTANLDGASMNYVEISNIIKAVLKEYISMKKLFGALSDIVHHPLSPPAIALEILILLELLAYLTTFVLGPALLFLSVGLLLAVINKFRGQIPQLIGQTARNWSENPQHANPKSGNQTSRHAELNIAAFNNVAGQPASNEVPNLRKELWAEHLGFLTPQELDSVPAGGWLKLWNDKADEKVTEIKQHQLRPIQNHPVSGIKVLKWQPFNTPTKQLEATGFKLKLIHLRSKADSYDYLKGKWNPIK